MKSLLHIFAYLLCILSSPHLYSQTGAPYQWPAYKPTISYNFKDEFPGLPQPNNILNDCPEVVGTTSDRWWCFRWGPDKNPVITNAAVTNMLERLNTDFQYFRDTMGWPPDHRAKNGYRSAVYLYGSGLCTDNASNTDLGGWQSSIRYNNRNWPMILASYYPVRAFDPAYNVNDKEFQTGAMVHEGIHALLADLPGVKQSAWFHEGGNVWLQQEADARRSGNYISLGQLNGTDFIAPFMPIECYSGWLVDGSFGGPSAEGVNKFNGNQQLCSWRNFLGGHQYSSTFPTFLGLTLGNSSVPWIWRNAPRRVLEGIASGIGETQMRRLIVEYRAKMALVDFGIWKDACINLLDRNFGINVDVEWQPAYMDPDAWRATPYAATTNNNGLLTPENRTLPGWSGSNQIPLHVTGNMVTVNFEPIGSNMTCQLVYRSTNGTPVYSEFVSGGNCSLRLDLPPADGVVIAVITNTDYIYNGEATRTAKFDYRLRLVSGVSATASINTRWYRSANLITGIFSGDPDGSVNWADYCNHHNKDPQVKTEDHFHMYPNPVTADGQVVVCFTNPRKERTGISVFTETGESVFEEISTGVDHAIDIKELKKGIYFVRITNSRVNAMEKLVVK